MKKFIIVFLEYLFSLIFAIPLTILALLIVSLISILFIGLPLTLLFLLFIIFYIPSLILFIIGFKRNLWKKWIFWIFSLILPLFILISFDIFFPYIQNKRALKYEKMFFSNIGFSSYDDFYRVKEKENCAKFIPILDKISNENKDSLKVFFSYYDNLDNYADTILKNKQKIQKFINPFLILTDSFYFYDDFQFAYIGDYKDSILNIPLISFSNVKILTNANMLESFLNLNTDEVKSISRIEKLWKISNLISYEPFLIYGMISIYIKERVLDFIIYVLKKDKIKNYKLVSDFVENIYNESEKRLTIIPSKEIIKEGKIRWVSPIYFEAFYTNRYMDYLFKSFMLKPILYYSSEFSDLSIFEQLSLIVSILPFYNSIYYLSKPVIYKKNIELYPTKFADWKQFKEYFIKEDYPGKFDRIYSDKKYTNLPYFIITAFLFNPTRMINRDLNIKAKTNLLKAYFDFKNGKQDWNKEDPFSLDKFIYKIDGNISRIYSVGENLKDDGGKEDDISIEWDNKNKKLVNFYTKQE